MRNRLSGLVPLLPLILLACGTRRDSTRLEENKALVRLFLQDIDQSQGSMAFIDKWMTPDFKSHAPGATEPIDLAGYRRLVSSFLTGFSDFRREVHEVVAENDLVSVVMTTRMRHTGSFQGKAATGREISLPEALVVRIRNGKIAEEWLVIDSGALQQQLGAPTSSAQR
jgi:predicted ester cyclase